MPDPTRRFRELHESSCFTMPNAWDAGSAKLLASHGFPALGTTSAGLAYQLGVKDAAANVPLDLVLDNIRTIAGAVDIPVSADFENGYAERPEALARNVRRCVETGAAGCSIEDWDGSKFYPAGLAAERIAAAVEAAAALDSGFVITARAERLLHGGPGGMDDVVDRLARFAAAGAHCVYAPGLRTADHIRRVAEAVDAPINVLVGIAGLHARADDMAALGVRRLSVGGSLMRTALAAVALAAQEMAHGVFDFPDRAIPEADLQAHFAARGRSAS